MKEGGGRVEAIERDMVCGGDGMRVRGVSIIRCMATSCVDMNTGYRGCGYREGVWITGGAISVP